MDRRDFLKTGAYAIGGSALLREGISISPIRRITIHAALASSVKSRIAVQELLSGLRALRSAPEISLSANSAPGAGTVHLQLAVNRTRFNDAESYAIARTDHGAMLAGGSEQAVLYAVFDFLERQGVVFGIDGASIPIDRAQSLRLPPEGQSWTAKPEFAVRGLLPWPDFLNCISVYNTEDFHAYFANMLRMRMNMFAMHVYPDEAYLSYDFAGTSSRAHLETTATGTWGYKPQRISTFTMGGAEFYDRETFGSDAERLATDVWDVADRTRAMLRAAFDRAAMLGIRTGIGFEPGNIGEIAIPRESRERPGGLQESPIGRDVLERRLADLLERYPMVNDIWLWEDEDVTWDSRGQKLPAPTRYFTLAHDFLRRHAPDKRLVISGWGGVTRNFVELHEKLPGDIIFSSLGDQLGWDPTSENFGKLGTRERWPIPWLEDDPSMWFPQYRASVIERDTRDAKRLGCQGMLGIHWRHRIVDPTLSYFARRGWSSTLTATDHYRSYAAAQASGARASDLVKLFVACDQGHQIVSTSTGRIGKDGHTLTLWVTPDYVGGFTPTALDAAFPPEERRDPKAGPMKLDAALLESQREIAKQFAALARAAASPEEKARLEYLAGYVGIMVPYCDANGIGADLYTVLATAAQLRKDGKEIEARTKVAGEAVPLWLKLAPLVREVVLRYQHIVSERTEQGQLASMHNKLVRITLEQLRLTLKEFLGQLPPEVDRAYAAAIAPDPSPPRLFIPTRPPIVAGGDTVRLFLVVPNGSAHCTVALHTRASGSQRWTSHTAKHLGRSVYEAILGPFAVNAGPVEYYASARIPGRGEVIVAPAGGADRAYSVAVV